MAVMMRFAWWFCRLAQAQAGAPARNSICLRRFWSGTQQISA